MKRTNYSITTFALAAALLGALTGCATRVDGPRYAGVYAQPPPVYVQGGVVVRDDYVYYPGYQVYYSSHRRHYIYQDGRAWVSRPAPPRVSANVLFASPSVNMYFHDAPSIHHAAVVRQYPKHWVPAGTSRKPGQERRDDGKGEAGHSRR